MKRLFFLIAVLVLPLLAQAVVPEYGMYYNSFRQGLGYYVEVQGTTMVMVVYAYDEDTGKPLFYYAAGPITKGKHLISATFSSATPMLYDYPYQFSGPLYRFDEGPCLTCKIEDWDTSEHAVRVGQVVIQFYDMNRFVTDFWMDNGEWVSNVVTRQAFNRDQYFVRHSYELFGPVVWFPFPSYQGQWVFSDMSKPETPVWSLNFDRVSGTYIPESDPFDPQKNYDYGHGDPVVDFIDDGSNAMLKCYQYGCRLTAEGRDNIYMKFYDAGMDRALGYLGDYIDADMGAGDGGFVHPDQMDIYYRTDHLVRGVHIVDPIPDAAPPPEENP